MLKRPLFFCVFHPTDERRFSKKFVDGHRVKVFIAAGRRWRRWPLGRLGVGGAAAGGLAARSGLRCPEPARAARAPRRARRAGRGRRAGGRARGRPRRAASAAMSMAACAQLLRCAAAAAAASEAALAEVEEALRQGCNLAPRGDTPRPAAAGIPAAAAGRGTSAISNCSWLIAQLANCAILISIFKG